MSDFIPLWDRKKKVLSKRMAQIKDLRNKNNSYAEISEKLGIAPGTINVIVWRANKRIKQAKPCGK